MDSNPLLAPAGHPRYRSIRAEHVEPAVRQRIAEWRELADRCLAPSVTPAWDSVVGPLDEAAERIQAAFRPVAHLVHVLHDDAMRRAHARAQALVVEHETARGQDERLWKALTAIRARADADGLTAARKKILDDELRDFRLAGVHLPPAQKARAAAIFAELSKLSVEFAQHVTDEMDAWRLVVDRKADVEGLPDTLVAAARRQALKDDPSAPPDRWSFTLHMPCLQPFLTYQRNRALREAMYRANATRCTSGPRDNTAAIRRTVGLRAELAKLLGFANYAEMALQGRMAKTPAEVHAFLVDLARRARPHAERQRDELAKIARERDGVTRLERWDLLYYREIARRERYDFADEDVRRHLPADRVLAGLGEVVRRLYGVTIADRTADARFETWHDDVRVLEFTDADGTVLGHVYADLYARPGKQTGAWVGGIVARRMARDGSVRLPAATLVCNFTPPADGRPSLLRHDEARTLFHESGHALHHMLTRVVDPQCSGTANVAHDGVELPSQFFENWIWHREPLTAMSSHVDTGEPLPAALLGHMLAARNHCRAIDIIRQMEFALSDAELHMSAEPMDDAAIRRSFAESRERVAVLPLPEWDRFENGFLHIFAGGYSAGYYGYAWAEVLAADAFSRFEEEGIWSQRAARDFRDQVLANGGAAELMDLYVAFRGRRPTPDALLRSAGLA
jgi:oligopeptidase A